MTKLATTSELYDTVRFSGGIEELTASFDSALETATSNLERDLRVGSFTRATRFDLFSIINAVSSLGIFGHHFRLNRGFIDSSQTFTVRLAASISDFGTNDTDVTDQAIIDYDLGTVSIIGNNEDDIRVPGTTGFIVGNFIRIDYTSGFNEDDNPSFFNTEEVPSWLKQAAILNGVVVVDSIDPKLRAEGDSTINPKILQNVYYSSIEAHIRYFPKYQVPAAKT